MMSRRLFLSGTAIASALAATGLLSRIGKADAADGQFEIVKSEAEWKKLLTPEQYYVLREEGTERAGTSPLNKEKREGTYHCAGCNLALFSSETKYESGTGWPSFYAPLDNAVGTSEDRSFFMTRTEVHCRRCGGHLGHVFDDGPPPTGKRYCMNGVAMTFEASGAA
ncbi:peptide-methionine (R)-S-oxide reductase MsrB [Parvibaculum sp.]|uniref:peptide-methionine (R)-S-oxide reductase MsrB n=1 Tax=Parvibaculum sp. TaxID=2024848 RepID=UPI001B140EED|nr:peptide-methionine (R)-S-oxide reductase MsrB [Parvibaculum sp.]MBO6635594.1 peptide-methionine (R)-S-oxide reductase MsrB [Parvibaculum sp.]MBO6677186.1 peptide-methionine (R)-S-oxide reductase MsrB [Parvibaculum sp.]MBO6685029.1 peptide-methionine (R)-S-oxide reductase MsrB [Parvibaculum sp.]MBO6906146.1 peptide-methionine (R)-S-oxide reductase MsrB [Parvibaculum sp.]